MPAPPWSHDALYGNYHRRVYAYAVSRAGRQLADEVFLRFAGQTPPPVRMNKSGYPERTAASLYRRGAAMASTRGDKPRRDRGFGGALLRRRGSFMSGQFLGSHGVLQLTMVS
jgi:hypothetical protein